MPSPFAALSADPVEIPDSSNERGILFYDLEAVPDESRFPKPESNESDSSIPDDEFSADVIMESHSTVGKLTKFIAENTLSGPQYQALLEQEKSSGKPRLTAVDTIQKALNAGQVEFNKWLKGCSTSPFKAQIVAMGWCVGDGEIKSLTARTDDEERAILTKFWELNANGRTRCGYNINRYDDILIAVRSHLLGVDHKKLNISKYSNRECVDLMIKMFPAGSPMKCKELAHAMDVTPPAGDVDGSQVYWMYGEEKMAEIGEYVRSDVFVERELYFALCEMFHF